MQIQLEKLSSHDQSRFEESQKNLDRMLETIAPFIKKKNLPSSQKKVEWILIE